MGKWRLPDGWFEELIDATLNGVPLDQFCKDTLGCATGTVLYQFMTLPDGPALLARYIDAQRMYFQGEGLKMVALADECEPDMGAVRKAQLQITTRQFALGRMLPKLWGNVIHIDGEGVATPLIISEKAIRALQGEPPEPSTSERRSAFLENRLAAHKATPAEKNATVKKPRKKNA